MPIRRVFRRLPAWLAALPCLSCSAHALDQGSEERAPHVESSVAAAGKARLFVGQDVSSIEAYATQVGAPRGIVSYTSLRSLEGLEEEADAGGGAMHLGHLANTFPSLPIALGLYLVGSLEAVNRGELDPNIERLAEQLAGFQVPVLLRVGYEFDGPWNGYEPEPYRAAFVRIATRMRERAPRVELVWQAAASCGGTFGQRAVDDWYPGDAYVDWIATSYFTQSACQFRPIKRLLSLARAQEKPFFIAEATPQGYDLGDGTFSVDGRQKLSKSPASIDSEWFAPYFAFVEENLDVVRAVTYINADWDSQRMWGAPYQNGYFGDSRVQANAELLGRWQGYVAAEHWQ